VHGHEIFEIVHVDVSTPVLVIFFSLRWKTVFSNLRS